MKNTVNSIDFKINQRFLKIFGSLSYVLKLVKLVLRMPIYQKVGIVFFFYMVKE